MRRNLSLLLLGGAGAVAGAAADASASVTKNSDGTLSGSLVDDTITLRSDGESHDIFIIDHGVEWDGLPTFEVLDHSGDTSGFEMTYSETRAMLDKYMGDGPLSLAAAMDTYRVNRYNITENKVFTNRLIQGGQRYQKLNLSTAGELVLGSVGLKFLGIKLPVEDIAGKFECSDETLNNIWATGARTIQRTEIDAETIPEFYEISDEGLLCESQAPQPYSSIAASALTSYDLTFHVKPVKGGFGYTVLSDTLGVGIYIFVDVDNQSIAAFAGSSELDGPALVEESLSSGDLSFGDWYKVETKVEMTEIEVLINDETALKFSQQSSFYGSFGLGASFQHKAVYQNVSLSTGGSEIYQSSLTTEAALEDFLAGTNPLSVSVDGARRDRIAYSGDLEIAIRSTLASTYGIESLNGSFELLGSFQLTPGFFVPTVKIQQSPMTDLIPANVTGLIGYSFNLVSAMGEFYMMTGDDVFARRWATAIKAMLDWAHSQSTGPTGLFNLTDPTFGGDWNYYDPTQSGVVSKFNAVYAHALQSALPLLSAASANATTSPYDARLTSLRKAMNTHLWAANLTAYALSTTTRSAFAQDANAIAILANVPASTNATSAILASMRDALFLPAGTGGALAFSPNAPGFSRKASPYASSYHLRAALSAGDAESASHLLRTMYAPMADPAGANYTGCFWETLEADDGAPGLGDATSLCHAWGAGPTGELTRFVLGVAPAAPGFEEWTVAPAMGPKLGVEWARGAQRTPSGDVAVEWEKVEAGGWGVNVTAPAGTKGEVRVPVDAGVECAGWGVDGEKKAGECVFGVDGGEKVVLRQP